MARHKGFHAPGRPLAIHALAFTTFLYLPISCRPLFSFNSGVCVWSRTRGSPSVGTWACSAGNRRGRRSGTASRLRPSSASCSRRSRFLPHWPSRRSGWPLRSPERRVDGGDVVIAGLDKRAECSPRRSGPAATAAAEGCCRPGQASDEGSRGRARPPTAQFGAGDHAPRPRRRSGRDWHRRRGCRARPSDGSAWPVLARPAAARCRMPP